MSRKDAINSLFLTKPEPPALSPAKSPDRVRTGAIGAMGASLQQMSETAKAAEKLKQQLVAGEAVVSLDPSLIEGTTIADRIPIEIDPSFDQLVASIKDNGQQVPILVRPHPASAGRFQIGYGRRRLRAAERLGCQVKAIVRELSDAELVIAQGRENLDRQDLSFIEKALFAKRLEDGGYDRSTIIAALSTDKADLSRYIAIARRIPEALIRQIGPAPKSGRSRWVALAERIDEPKVLATIEAALADPGAQSMESDARFSTIWQAIERSRRRVAVRTETWSTPQGKRAGQIQRGNGKTTIVFNEKVVPEFAAFVSSRLDILLGEFLEQQEGNGAKPS